MSFSNRYPVRMDIYCQKTGRLLVHRIGQVLKAWGFKTWINLGQNNGVDLKVWKGDMLVLVGEVLNWSPYTNLSSKRKNTIISNLTDPQYGSCCRMLIYTTMKNEHAINNLHLYNIISIKLDDQILPRYFYNHYSGKKQVKNRKIDSRTTTNNIQVKLSSFLLS